MSHVNVRLVCKIINECLLEFFDKHQVIDDLISLKACLHLSLALQ